jgi:hypothetical protein
MITPRHRERAALDRARKQSGRSCVYFRKDASRSYAFCRTGEESPQSAGAPRLRGRLAIGYRCERASRERSAVSCAMDEDQRSEDEFVVLLSLRASGVKQKC